MPKATPRVQLALMIGLVGAGLVVPPVAAQDSADLEVAVVTSAVEILAAPPGSELPGAHTDLDSLFAAVPDSVTVRFAPGVYTFTPEPYLEQTCGTCEIETTTVAATVGLQIRGSAIRLLGAEAGETVFQTGSGYGVLFEDCTGCRISGITITGGVRDAQAEATDAAIVVKGGSVEILECTIRDNIGDSTTVAGTVAGIMGVAARDGGRVTLTGNRILRNSWDGIGLFRGAQAVIEENVIDGVDLARGADIGGGRGVGIGLTWNAFATVRGNLVRNYWKGIGVFMDAQATVEENVIENIATWGMALWDGGTGRPGGFFRRNVVYKTGACGITVTRNSADRPPPGQLILNAFINTGQDPQYDADDAYCFQEAIAEHAVPQNFTISANLPFRNREATGRSGQEDLDRNSFEARLRPLWDSLDRWSSPKESTFWRDYHGLE